MFQENALLHTMFPKAVQTARELFKVSRDQQQFPHLPFIFGAYDFPQLSFFAAQFQSTYERELKQLYRDFVDNLVNKNLEALAGNTHNKLLIKCDKSLLLLESMGIKLGVKERPEQVSLKAFATLETVGPYCLHEELNPPESAVQNGELLVSEPQYSEFWTGKLTKEMYTAHEQFDPASLIVKIRKGVRLTQAETKQLHFLHVALQSEKTVTTQVLAVVRDNRNLVLSNRKGEDVDGETTPNVHVLKFQKLSTVGSSFWLENLFLLDHWFLVDVDFLIDDVNALRVK